MTDIEELKYVRIGHQNEGRPCDEYVDFAFHLLPGNVLPLYWRFSDDFVKTYGDGPLWAKPYNYHMLIYKGSPVVRIWTWTKSNEVWVTVHDDLVDRLKETFSVYEIPEGNLVGSCPHTKRILLSSLEDVGVLMSVVRRTYGFDR